MRILELPVNAFFFNQVKDETLIEDFRAIKPYWIKKLVKSQYQNKEPIEIVKSFFNGTNVFNKFDKVIFKNGYSDSSPKMEVIFDGLRFTQPHEMTCMGKGIAFAIKVKYL